MRTPAAIAVGLSIGAALVGLLAGDVVLLCGALAVGVIASLYLRRSPPDRRRTVRAIVIGLAVFGIVWLIAVIAVVSSVPEDFNEAF